MAEITKENLMGVISSPYEPTGFVNNYYSYAPHQRPVFSRFAIRQMLEDPRICFGLGLIKGPIHAFTKFFTEEEAKNPAVHRWIVESDTSFPYVIKCQDKEVSDFISTTLKRFWQVGAIKALKALEWGYSAAEVVYKMSSGDDGRNKKMIHFDNLLDFNPPDCVAVSQQGGLVGCEINSGNLKEFYLGIPKLFWHIHAREQQKYYGISRLFGAYAAWWEIWTEGGARDIRRLWFYRNAFDGGIMRYPIGYTQLEGGGRVNNRDLAIEMLAKKRAGGYLIFPNQTGADGRQVWDYEPPSSASAPPGMAEYMAFLTNEELEGLGIPPEVIQGGGGGLGAATGRKIPMVAFYSSLQQIVDFLIGDVRVQMLDFLIRLNFRKLPDYEVVPLIPIEAYVDNSPSSQEAKGSGEGKASPTPKIEKTESGTPNTLNT
jgi:hypothetical protein